MSISSIAQQSSSLSSGTTITLPASINAGDIIVIWDCAEAGVTPTSVTPTGFTKVSESTAVVGPNQRTICSFKIADGTESSAVVTGMAGSTAVRKICVTFRADDPVQTVAGTYGEVHASSGTGNPAAQTVLAAAAVAPLIVLGLYSTSIGGGSTVINPRTFTVGGSAAKDGEVSGTGSFQYVAWKIYISSPADVVVDMDDEGALNTVAGLFLQCTGTPPTHPAVKRGGGVAFMGAGPHNFGRGRGVWGASKMLLPRKKWAA